MSRWDCQVRLEDDTRSLMVEATGADEAYSAARFEADERFGWTWDEVRVERVERVEPVPED